MIIEIDIKKLIAENISIQNYLFLQLVYNQQSDLLFRYKVVDKLVTKDDILFLMSINLLEFVNKDNEVYTLANLKVTDRFIDVFLEDNVKESKKGNNSNNVEEWIDEWYELFPKGVRSGGYLVRSGKKGCLTKMKAFVKENPEYDKEIIMKATRDYLAHSRLKNYAFIQLAHYYISKNKTSVLASGCEMIVNSDDKDSHQIDYIDDI